MPCVGWGAQEGRAGNPDGRVAKQPVLAAQKGDSQALRWWWGLGADREGGGSNRKIGSENLSVAAGEVGSRLSPWTISLCGVAGKLKA